MSRPTPLRPAPPGAPAFGATAALRRWFGPAYDWRLGWPRPDGPKLLPVDPWPGDAVSGSTWLADPGRADPAFGDHGFAWLRDLRAVGGDEARHIGRQCILDWVGRHGRWHPDAWAPAVTGARLQSWLYGYEFFLGAADDDSRARVLQSVARQIRHLAWHRPPATPGAGLAAALGVVFGRLALEGRVAPETELEPALAAIGRSLLDDGLHVSRSPAVHLAVLADVVGLRALLVQADLAVPLALSTAIDRMAPVARMLRHGDGGLALFHGRAQHRMPGLVSGAVDRVSNEGRPAVTDAVIARADRDPAGPPGPLRRPPGPAGAAGRPGTCRTAAAPGWRRTGHWWSWTAVPPWTTGTRHPVRSRSPSGANGW